MSADARPLAGRLLAAGVPVVVVRYGEKPPAEWQHLTAEERHLSAYRPGRDALALVGGHGIDLVDEDTKDAGSADNLPPFQALRRDPDPDRRAAPGRAVQRARQDFAADHRSRARRRLRRGPPRRVRELARLPARVGPVKARSMAGARTPRRSLGTLRLALAPRPTRTVHALSACGGSRTPRERYLDDSPQRDPALGLHRYAAAAITEELARLEALPHPWSGGSYWDATTFEVACNLLDLANSGWTGYTEEQALQDLLDRAPSDGAWGATQNRAKWTSAVKTVEGGGRREPERPTPEDDFEVEGGEGEAALAEDGGGADGGWGPVDLVAAVAGLLDGTVIRPEPTVGDLGGAACSTRAA
jgi:hypothetical protein